MRILNLLSCNSLATRFDSKRRKFISKEYFNALKNLSEPINKIKKKNQHFYHRQDKNFKKTRIN